MAASLSPGKTVTSIYIGNIGREDDKKIAFVLG
jgi:hypothetical protein